MVFHQLKGKSRTRFVFVVFVVVFFFVLVRFTFIGTIVTQAFTTLQARIFSQARNLWVFFNKEEDLEHLRQKYQDLYAKNARLLIENVRLNILESQNKELKRLLEYKQDTQEKIVVARIVGKPSEPIAKAWIVDKGTKDGIQKGQAVVGYGSYLVGIVANATKTTSTIILVQDNQFRIAAMTLRSARTSGLVEGSFGTGITMNLIPKTVRIEIGDTVVTSGIEELIPKGLIVGTIDEITTQSNDLFQSAVIGRDEHLQWLDFVGIIVQNP